MTDDIIQNELTEEEPEEEVREIRNIEDLTPDPDNVNVGTERGLAMLEDSLRKYGAGRSIVVDKDGVVIAGNKTLERAADLGFPVRVIKTDGKELVVVQREDLDLDSEDGRARELAYTDNRSGEVGLDWDTKKILEDVQEGVDLSGLWSTAELIRLVTKGAADRTLEEIDLSNLPEKPQWCLLMFPVKQLPEVIPMLRDLEEMGISVELSGQQKDAP